MRWSPDREQTYLVVSEPETCARVAAQLAGISPASAPVLSLRPRFASLASSSDDVPARFAPGDDGMRRSAEEAVREEQGTERSLWDFRTLNLVANSLPFHLPLPFQAIFRDPIAGVVPHWRGSVLCRLVKLGEAYCHCGDDDNSSDIRAFIG